MSQLQGMTMEELARMQEAVQKAIQEAQQTQVANPPATTSHTPLVTTTPKPAAPDAGGRTWAPAEEPLVKEDRIRRKDQPGERVSRTHHAGIWPAIPGAGAEVAPPARSAQPGSAAGARPEKVKDSQALFALDLTRAVKGRPREDPGKFRAAAPAPPSVNADLAHLPRDTPPAPPRRGPGLEPLRGRCGPQARSGVEGIPHGEGQHEEEESGWIARK